MFGWDKSGSLVWSIDTSFAVYTDMKSHTGYCPTLGNGLPISGSYKQGVNTKSSIEAELVGVDDAIGFVELSNWELRI